MADTVTVGERDYPVEAFCLDKTMMVADIISDRMGILVVLNTKMEEWRAAEGKRRADTFTRADIEGHEQLRHFYADHDWDAEPTLTIANLPKYEEAAAKFFPELWSAMRPEVLTVLCILASDNAAFLRAYDTHRDDYEAAARAMTAEQERNLRFIATLPQLAAFLVACGRLNYDSLRLALGEDQPATIPASVAGNAEATSSTFSLASTAGG